uniref:Uncharacterized protein n=1 Tax=Anguilla anguilla TaxID=7936 RepID=A0A0E9XRB4_ANGAN
MRSTSLTWLVNHSLTHWALFQPVASKIVFSAYILTRWNGLVISPSIIAIALLVYLPHDLCV